MRREPQPHWTRTLAAVLVAGWRLASPAALGAGQATAAPLPGNQPAPPVRAWPAGQLGKVARYRLQRPGPAPASTVSTYSLALGPGEDRDGRLYYWLKLEAVKVNGVRFRVWLLTTDYPAETVAATRASAARYVLQEGNTPPRECRHQFTGAPVLPAVGGWRYLWPRSTAESGGAPDEGGFPRQTRYLGLDYQLETVEASTAGVGPGEVHVLTLLPDVLVGPASNTRQKDETRRYDDSDYQLTPLTLPDYCEMAAAGINCVRVDARQLAWIESLPLFYWGVGGADVPCPECLYRSQYLGPALFLDEPAVGTRDYVIRPRLAKEPGLRRGLTPAIMMEAFAEHFRQASQEGASRALLRGLAGRPDVDLGEMSFPQENLFCWETIEATAAYELSRDPSVPAAFVFEPPGRVGTRRTLPELDMTYGCQIPTQAPRNFTSIIYGFLRGAARLTGKTWGTSIYGAVDRADAPWFITHAYDLGATHFFFWDNYRLACVPYGECLALARTLRAHAGNHPNRDLARLRQAAEAAILLPPGYNLGHVHLGKGSLWGLGELNLERLNSKRVRYRAVMANFFAEIERCLRFGVEFDLLWELEGLPPAGYREVIRIREDGQVEVETGGRKELLPHARTPERPGGAPPELKVELSADQGQAPLQVQALATVHETATPVYYTFGADPDGVYHNAAVAWELYGPGDEDYQFVQAPRLQPKARRDGSVLEVRTALSLRQPGAYRLRAATVDLAGRSTVVWTSINVTE